MKVSEMSQLIENNNVEWVQIHFTDLIGRLRVLHYAADTFLADDLIINGSGFDGSSVGMASVENSDMIAIPDIDTFHLLPHENDEARVIANIYNNNLKPFPGDPRYILKQTLEKVHDQGFDEVRIAPEMEFYVFQNNDLGEDYVPNASKGYLVPPPFDDVKQYRKDLAKLLVDCEYQVKYHHHEVGSHQHEIEVKSLPALAAADFCMFFKFLARDIAPLYDLLVTFMPKPLQDDAGNGMHAHLCLFKEGVNIFYDEHDKYRLSQTARYFIGGILDHARGIAAIANPTINSYKRLQPHFEAPIFVAWGQYNRSSLIRIPAKKNVNIEIRNADPAANPYLFYSAMIHAGLDGIQKKTAFDPIETNTYHIDDYDSVHGVRKLPSNLCEALEELESDDVVKNAIGSTAFELFTNKKRDEWKLYMEEITDLEYDLYLHC